MAQSNREEVLRAGGCVLLSQLLGVPHGPHWPIAAQILAELSKAAEALSQLVHSGCVRAATGLTLFFLRTDKMRWATAPHAGRAASAGLISAAGIEPARPGAKLTGHSLALETARVAFLDVLAMLANVSAHAAGVHRARGGFDFLVAPQGTNERVDYRYHLQARSTLTLTLSLTLALTLTLPVPPADMLCYTATHTCHAPY